MPFDMNRTWSQAIALVRANFQLLALIAAIFLLLPELVGLVALPDLSPPANETVDFNALGRRLLDNPPVLAAMLVIVAISIAGYGAMIALMGPQRPTVGAAIGRGAMALPTVIGYVVVLALGYLVVGTALGFVIVLLGTLLGASQATLSYLLVLISAVLLFYVGCRSAVIVPVIVHERTANPLRAFARSWRLTKPARGRIVAFFLLLVIGAVTIQLVTGLALKAVGLLIEDESGGRFLTGLLGGLVGMVLAMIGCGIAVSMHEQLAGTSASAQPPAG